MPQVIPCINNQTKFGTNKDGRYAIRICKLSKKPCPCGHDKKCYVMDTDLKSYTENYPDNIYYPKHRDNHAERSD